MNQDSDPFACHLDLHSKLTMLLFWGRDPHLVTWDEVQIWGDFEMFETTVPCPESFRLHRWAVAASWIWRKDHRHACKRNTSWKRIRTPRSGSDQVKTQVTMVSVVFFATQCKIVFLPEKLEKCATDPETLKPCRQDLPHRLFTSRHCP